MDIVLYHEFCRHSLADDGIIIIQYIIINSAYYTRGQSGANPREIHFDPPPVTPLSYTPFTVVCNNNNIITRGPRPISHLHPPLRLFSSPTLPFKRCNDNIITVIAVQRRKTRCNGKVSLIVNENSICVCTI